MQFKRASDKVRMRISVLTEDVRSELARLRPAERTRRMKRWKIRDGAHFVKEPFKFTQELLRMDRPGNL